MKVIAIMLLLFLAVGTVDVFAQVNGTATNSTEAEPILETTNSTSPQIVITSTSHLQGDMLKFTGSHLEPNKTLEMTMFHPDNTKFGIFKATTTGAGEFQLLVEIAHTSKQGNYTAITDIAGTVLTNHFVYSGAHQIETTTAPQVIEQTVPPATSTAPPATTSSSSGSSYTAPTTTNADLKGILELLRTIIQANNAILTQIEAMLASMG